MKNRRGFTLVELLVAVLLIDVGLLALVAGTAIVVRRHGELRLRTLAWSAASNRIQSLVADGCRHTTGMRVVAPGVTESWEAIDRGSGTRELRDSVAYAMSGATPAVVLRTRVAC
jgi:prepilin-type N-terminal cleavage/methylation domain-containing protein